MIDILPWQRAALAELLGRGNRIPHALLVHGRSGIGKVRFARALAQSLLCEAADAGMACGQCPACGWFVNGNHPDFRELLPEALMMEDVGDDTAVEADIDAKEKKKSREIKIDQIRGIADFMTLTTHRDGWRVLMVHPAEAMNPAAANALLKTLEEPPARTVILLISDQPGRLMATIRSRCQRVLLPTPGAEAAQAWLRAQGVANIEEALAAAGGAPLDAVEFADADYQSARRAFVKVLADSCADYAQSAQDFEKADMNHLLTWLQTWVNDLILSRMAGLVCHHQDQAKSLARLADQAGLSAMFQFERELRQTRRLINHPLNARLLLEQLLIGYKQAVRPAR